MAKCHRDNVGPFILDRHDPTTNADVGGNFRLWNALSASSFRRIIFDVVSCGSSSRYHHSHCDDFSSAVSTTTSTSGNSKEKHREQRQRPSKSKRNSNGRSEKLLDLLHIADSENLTETKTKEEALEELKQIVEELQGEDLTKRQVAASNVRLLAKENLEVRGTLAMLGVIPPLVGMLELEDANSQIASLYALLNLGIGNDENKAAIVQIGAVHKMLKLIESPPALDTSISEAIAANFLSLSALDSNKSIIGSSDAIPFLVRALKNSDNTSSPQAKQDALRALYNLSISQTNISFILETDLVPHLINAIGDMEVSERVLPVLSNLASVAEGRKAISAVPDAFPILVDVLNWADAPGCQEKASYILMIMAHKAYGNRQAMIEAGIVSSLLELTLLGTQLAQKRASRILQCLRVVKGKQVSGSCGGHFHADVSAPMYGGSSSSCTKPRGGGRRSVEGEDDMMSEEKKAVKQLVRQSLQNSMRKIVKRANIPQEFVPSEHFKSLTSSSISKSLPF